MDERIVPNTDPIASDLFGSVHAGSNISLLPSLSDPDNDPVEIISVGTPTLGSIAFSGGTLTFTAGTTVGSETLTYTVSDGQGGFANAFLNLEVTNTAPAVINYDVYAHAGTIASVTPALADPDFGDTPTITAVGSAPTAR